MLTRLTRADGCLLIIQQLTLKICTTSAFSGNKLVRRSRGFKVLNCGMGAQSLDWKCGYLCYQSCSAFIYQYNLRQTNSTSSRIHFFIIKTRGLTHVLPVQQFCESALSPLLFFFQNKYYLITSLNFFNSEVYSNFFS